MTMSDQPTLPPEDQRHLHVLILMLKTLGHDVVISKNYVFNGREGYVLVDNNDGTMTVRYRERKEDA